MKGIDGAHIRIVMRVALLVLIAACSSAKPTDGRSSASRTASAKPEGSASADPRAAKAADPADDLARLREDVDIMCGAAKTTGGKTFMEVGPHIAENMQTYHKQELFADVRNATLDELIARMRALMAKANVTQCDTVDVLIANDPRKRSQD